ncbi:MAG: glucoamylase family protein [Marinifilaceae bacterium]|jgi:hypothetical protein
MKKYLFSILIALGGLLSCAQAEENSVSEDSKEQGGQTGNRPLEFDSDDEFLDFIQKQHFNYMWEGAEPNSGLACERIHPDNNYPQNDRRVVTTGGSGFGIMGLIVGMERNFVTREEGVDRFYRIVEFLEKAEKHHGVWPHWMNGEDGTTRPFSPKDDGGDLVESSFLMQGLLCARQYFANGNEREKELAQRIDALWQGMDWAWYMNGKDVLYWHWSPNCGWEMNFALEGYNECLITYILAASSPTHPIPASAYHNGWARGGAIVSSDAPFGFPLELKHNSGEGGGPLFWAHYSYIGLNPQGLKDQYADYWNVVKNHTLANYSHCVSNPKGYKGYGINCWGLTASYSINGYAAHSPADDRGVITPTAALSSFPYTPEKSMRALKHFYYQQGDRLWGEYGFYDAFSVHKNWYSNHYLAIDQCTIAPMIENHRTGLLWKLFMSCPEVQEGLKKLGFTQNQ